MAERLKPKKQSSVSDIRTEKRFTVGQWLRYEKGSHFVDRLGELGGNSAELNYRTRASQSIPQRDYFVGNVHIAYCRVSQKIYHLFITNGNEEVSIKGVHFDTENAMHEFILKELMA